MSFADHARATSAIEITDSPLESDRFGFRVLRAILGSTLKDSDEDVTARLASEDFDLLVVRYPANRTRLFQQLERLPAMRVIHADTLLYWELPGDIDPLPNSSWTATVELTNPTAILESVRDSFRDYPNHYSASPELNMDDVLNGYLEWAEPFLSDESGRFTIQLQNPDGRVGGFTMCLEGEYPELVLTAVEPWARGQGTHQQVIEHASAELRRRQPGCRIVTSTQAHNLAALRSWSRIGMRPCLSLQTLHLWRTQ